MACMTSFAFGQHTTRFNVLDSSSTNWVLYQLRAVTARIPRSEFFITCGDWNGHLGHADTKYREVHGGKGYGRSEPDVEGERILEYAIAFDLLLGNTCFKKH